MLLLRKLDHDLLLLTTSWLTSRETTCLRATSQGSRQLVLRNIPLSTADIAYCEAVTRPEVKYCSVSLGPHFNRFSPLRCWQFTWADVDMQFAPRHLKRDKGFNLFVVAQC